MSQRKTSINVLPDVDDSPQKVDSICYAATMLSTVLQAMSSQRLTPSVCKLQMGKVMLTGI